MQIFEEKYHSDRLIPYLSVPVGAFILHRYDHLKHTLSGFTDGVQKGLATGTFQFAGYCTWLHAWHHLFLGVPQHVFLHAGFSFLQDLESQDGDYPLVVFAS